MVRTTLATLLLLAAMLGPAGCERSKVDQPLATAAPGDTAVAMDFWHTLADRPVVTNNDALYGLICFKAGEDPNRDYAGRLQWMQQRGYLPKDFDKPPHEAAEVGTIASILVPMLDIKGGVTMRIIGPHPRYAVRELVYLKLLPPYSTQQSMPGIEFLGLISRAEDYQEQTL